MQSEGSSCSFSLCQLPVNNNERKKKNLFTCCHRSGDASSGHHGLGLRRSCVWILWHGGLGFQNISGHERRRRLHRFQNGWVGCWRPNCAVSKPKSTCCSVRDAPITPLIGWPLLFLLLQVTKAASWTVCQSRQRASSRRPPRPSGATSSCGRSRCPMNEDRELPPPTPPRACPQVFLFDLIVLNFWVESKKIFLVHFFVQFIVYGFETGEVWFMLTWRIRPDWLHGGKIWRVSWTFEARQARIPKGKRHSEPERRKQAGFFFFFFWSWTEVYFLFYTQDFYICKPPRPSTF